jgi:predicted RNA binding protein YcfA (HicA-like mRNA interferase family)
VTRLTRLTGSELIAALAKAGFQVVRAKGSHHFIRQGWGFELRITDPLE